MDQDLTPDALERARVRRALDMQARAKDFRLLDIPSYRTWSSRKLREGVSEALIAHLDATSMWLLPEEVEAVEEASFDELLEDLEADMDD